MTTNDKKKRLRNKCNALLQEYGRLLYDRCLICGGAYSCLHHHYTKASSTALRYDLDNCLPFCAGCHLQWHNGSNPEIMSKLLKIKGQKWHDDLTRRKTTITKTSLKYYEEQKERLEKLIREHQEHSCYGG